MPLPKSMAKVWNYKTLWPEIQTYLVKMLKSESISSSDWHNLFVLVHRVCLWDYSGPTHMNLSIEKAVREVVYEIRQRIMVHNDDLCLLKAYAEEWNIFMIQCYYIPLPFKEMEHALDGKLIDYNNLFSSHRRIDHMKKMMYQVWHDIIFNDIKIKIQKIVMNLISNERNGDIYDIYMIEVIKESFLYLNLSEIEPLKMYNEYYERPYIQALKSFYEARAFEYLETHGVLKYIMYARTKLREEEIRAHRYLDPGLSTENVTNMCVKVLISKFITTILSEYTYMIKRNDMLELRLLYNLVNRVPEGITIMIRDLEEYIVNTGLADMMASANIVFQDSEKYVTQLLMLFNQFSKLVKSVFRNDPRFLTARDKAYKKLVNDKTVFQIKLPSNLKSSIGNYDAESKCPELLANFSDMLLRKTNLSKRLTADEIEKKLEDVLLVLKYVQNKDIFVRYYIAHLSRRLILETSADSEKEESMVESLKSIGIPADYVHKLTRMFQDIKISQDLSQELKEIRSDNSFTDTVSIKILNSNAWIVGSANVQISLSDELNDHMSLIEQMYQKKHTGRKLLWCHHMSSSTVTFTSDIGQFDIDITTFQMAILLIWNQRPKDKISLENLRLITDLPDIVLRKTLWSLVAFPRLKRQILLTSSEIGSLKEFKENTEFWINEQFCLVKNGKLQKRGKLSLIGRLQLYIEQNKKEDCQSIVQLRTLRLQEGIIKILKMRKKISIVNLQKDIIEILKDMFMPSKRLIKEQIESLIEQSFIKRDENDINMFIYIS